MKSRNLPSPKPEGDHRFLWLRGDVQPDLVLITPVIITVQTFSLF